MVFFNLNILHSPNLLSISFINNPNYQLLTFSLLMATLHCLSGMKTELSKSKIYSNQSLAARLWVCVTDHVDVILPRALTAGITSSIDTGPYISDSLQLLNLELPSTWYPVGTTGRRWQWSYTGEMRLFWGQVFGSFRLWLYMVLLW